ncbi:hypothetical protein N7456_003382 [Penicillium angulare]|uniref:Uncharacterized protein n=1 Tax=Penicillium angulare TaxID=116970 RepID=A0A9W9FUP8_9EURO|nr:hypothetical protein N7456_003382 [Penicillium angulare]
MWAFTKIPMPWASIAASSNIQIPSAKVKYNRLKRMVEDARPGRLEPGQQSTNPPATAPLRRSERLSERPPEQRTRFSSEDASD